MNKVVLIGRLARDPSVRKTEGENESHVARFTLAVNRRYQKGKEQKPDYISCVAFGRTAEFVGKHFVKGKKMNLAGRIQTGSYVNSEDSTVYTMDVVADEIEFGESKKNAENENFQQMTEEPPFPVE